ncbi:flagellar biosynthesis anti-sigma factor FlgM [Erythrobacter sp. SCSIO 43205]|uniref:flagellar biosynthesis anti-sigma factor FlgM n=1 Tax=Erythrobacter sp. SCSIO 43205 TaxID=2779361 RepID=UPI001CA8BDAD|nr:flagellar biosynthesis anti-sigma factor FlgM [Erythrobacter sp. SCSIO 43205]UAB78716.1 flagellar biosynthesis anti-sigma factor FlgM [Erythrobacter sp. SCSIO 43205]
MNRLQSITGVSPVQNSDRAKAKTAAESGVSSSGGSAAGSTKAAGVSVEVATPAQSGPPVDTDRVAEIRDALRDGTYPLVPTKIADAMIAAQYKFESAQ